MVPEDRAFADCYVPDVARLIMVSGHAAGHFRCTQPFSQYLLLLPACGYVTDDGHSSEDLSITIRRQDDRELNGYARAVAPARRDCQEFLPVAGDPGQHDGPIALPVSSAPTFRDDQV